METSDERTHLRKSDSKKKKGRGLHTIPISERKSSSVLMNLHAIFFNLFFGSQMLIIHLVQLLILPLYIIPLGLIRRTYYRTQDYAKSCFGSSLLIITSMFAHTSLIITADESIDLDKIIKVDSKGNFSKFEFDHQSGEWLKILNRETRSRLTTKKKLECACRNDRRQIHY